MANVFVSNGSNYLEFPTLGVLTGKKVEIRLKNTSWSGGYLWSQASSGSSTRELGSYYMGTSVNIVSGGYTNDIGQINTVFGKDSLAEDEVYFSIGTGGAVAVETNGIETRNTSITRGTNRVDGEPFRIFARGGGYNAAAGDEVGDFEVWIDGVKVRDVVMPSDNTGDIVDLLDSANNGTLVGGDGDDFRVVSAEPPAVAPTDPAVLPTETPTKLVLLGASIQEWSTNYNVGDFTDYIQKVYGANVQVIERATGGDKVAQVLEDLPAILDEFDGDTGVRYGLHVLGNDIERPSNTYSLPFSSLDPAVQAQKTADLESIYDLIHARGQHVFQSSISHRNYNNERFDPSSEITSEVNGSYSYNTDCAIPVMANKAPYSVYDRDGQAWPYIDGYNMSRNFIGAWADASSDVVHPSRVARWVWLTLMIDGLMKLGSGTTLAPVPRRDFTAPVEKGSNIDVVIDFKPDANAANQTNPNINVVTPTNNYVQNLTQSDGSASTLSVYVTALSGETLGSGVGSTDAEIGNAEIHRDGVIHVESNRFVTAIVSGLEAFKEYEVTTVADTSADHPQKVYIHDVDDYSTVAIDAVTETTKTQNVVSDSLGRIFVTHAESASGNKSVLNGMQIKSQSTAANQPPIANAGPDQSVAAGVRVQLNASMSTDPEDGSISQFGWEQVDNGADSVVLEFANTATPEFTAPSSLTEQTLEFRVQAQDSEGATSTDTVTVTVAALEENAILSIMETLDFELVTQGNLIAFKGRSNREVMRLKPSSDVGIVTEDGYLDLSKNGIAKIEIIANGKKISNSNSDSIKIDGNRILARLGDLDLPTGGRDTINPTFMIVLYVGDDTRGLVVASNATAGYKPLSYRVEDAA